jgi:hypothetical protein
MNERDRSIILELKKRLPDDVRDKGSHPKGGRLRFEGSRRGIGRFRSGPPDSGRSENA